MPLVEYQGQRVVTFAMIDEAHQRPEGTAKATFNRNIRHFLEATDFVKVPAAVYREILDISTRKQSGKVCAYTKRTRKKSAEKITEDVTLVFESGYLMIVKPFKDDLSWQIQRELVNSYFRPVPHFSDIRPIPVPTLEELEAMPPQQAADLIAQVEHQSKRQHGQHGSAEMTQRRRELKLIRPAMKRVVSLIQLSIPGLEVKS